MTATIERTNDNSIINSFKRLERAGSGESKTTTKLIAAAREGADYIERIVTSAGLTNTKLPRGYYVEEQTSSWCDNCCCGCDTVSVLLNKHGAAVNSPGEFSSGHDDCYTCRGNRIGWPHTTLNTAQTFATDLVDGLLDEIAALLEGRTQESQRATEQIQVTLQAAQAKMSGAS